MTDAAYPPISGIPTAVEMMEMSERQRPLADIYLDQIRVLFDRMEQDCMAGRLNAADVMHIQSPWARANKLERAIIRAFLGSLYPQNAANR